MEEERMRAVEANIEALQKKRLEQIKEQREREEVCVHSGDCILTVSIIAVTYPL
jgi:hypothetical protein